MSHDGCEEVKWKGQAFSYLMHHPNSFLKTENYGSHRATHDPQPHGPTQHASSDSMAPAGTGTWNGPAPRGYLRDGAAPAQPTAVQQKQPQTQTLSNGLVLPMIGLGTAGIKSADVVKEALELGYRHLDCAAAYGNQTIIGEGIQPFLAAGRREELFITSKLHIADFRPAGVRAACEKVLSELGCQYLDLFLMHWPEAQAPEGAGKDDFWNNLTRDTTITYLDTWRAMEELVDAGLCKSIGLSNFSVKEVEDVLASCRVKPVANQVELHPYLCQRKLVGVCFRKGVQCVAYSPLGGSNYQSPNTLLTNQVVQEVAKECGKTPAQVLLKWNLQRGVPVIPKAGSSAHLKENIEGAFDWQLAPEHKARLDGLENGTRFCNPKWKDWGNPEEGGAAKPSLLL